MLIARAAVVSIVTIVLSLLLLGGTAAAVTVEPQSSTTTLTAAAPATAIAGAPAARAETVAPAAVTPAAATSLSPLEQLWQYLLALFQQFLARFFPADAAASLQWPCRSGGYRGGPKPRCSDGHRHRLVTERIRLDSRDRSRAGQHRSRRCGTGVGGDIGDAGRGVPADSGIR